VAHMVWTPSKAGQILGLLICDYASHRGLGRTFALVELKDIQLPDSMKRAMARQAEAVREKRAKIIAAEGESMAAARVG
jgi:hypothetical protein